MLLPSKSRSTEDNIKETVVSDNLIIYFGERFYELHVCKKLLDILQNCLIYGIYQIPSLPFRLGQSLEKCANILKCKAIENGLKDEVERMDAFLATDVASC
ncbi:hypothetical protein KUTeg_006336 [Tegillarca granosa]|uniref:Uncharacterized protein n=1 Tax=Tegillarca granosa TaxID=220873 RepID=A0ABQ9FIE1_TEGGR|nr:hypothetical protein KUTeg_006336 [Tegillarca granosa]